MESLMYLLIMLVVICVWFLAFKRPVYEAVLLDDGSVLRISVSRANALVLVLGMLQPITIVLVIAIVFS